MRQPLASCESFFCARIESRIESAVRFDFESNFRIESAVYTTQAVTPSNELQGAPCRRTVWAYMLTTSVVNVCVVLMCYLTPKLDYKRKFKIVSLQRTINGADDSKISNRIISTNRIPNRKFDSNSNQISKLRRSLV